MLLHVSMEAKTPYHIMGAPLGGKVASKWGHEMKNVSVQLGLIEYRGIEGENRFGFGV